MYRHMSGGLYLVWGQRKIDRGPCTSSMMNLVSQVWTSVIWNISKQHFGCELQVYVPTLSNGLWVLRTTAPFKKQILVSHPIKTPAHVWHPSLTSQLGWNDYFQKTLKLPPIHTQKNKPPKGQTHIALNIKRAPPCVACDAFVGGT